MSQQTKYRQLSEQYALPLFARPWWLDMVSDNWNAAIVEDEEQLQAVWPYTLEKKAGVSLVRNPLLTPYLGPYFFLSPELKQAKRFTKEDKIYTSLKEQLPAYDFFEVQCKPGYNNFLPFHQMGFEHTQRVTYEVDLRNPEAVILEQMDEGKRRHIRKASKDLTIVDGLPYLHQFYELHKQTFVRKDKKYPISETLFKTVANTALEKNAANLSAAVDAQGNVAALLFVVYDHERMYLLLSAVNQDALHHGAMTLLIWNAMKLGKNLGLNVFDFEGSMDAGIELYFRNFGGERVSYLSCTDNRSRLWKMKQAILG